MKRYIRLLAVALIVFAVGMVYPVNDPVVKGYGGVDNLPYIFVFSLEGINKVEAVANHLRRKIFELLFELFTACHNSEF